MLNWKKRAKRDDRNSFKRRVWDTKCGLYRVVESKHKYFATRYYAMKLVEQLDDWPNWDIISYHRKKETAMAACEKHAEENV